MVAAGTVLAVAAFASPARAGGLTVGASLGQSGGDQIADTRGPGAFARVRLGARSLVEVDLGRASPEDDSYQSTRLGAALLLELSDRGGGGATPYLLAGGGVTHTESMFWIGEHRHLEVGAGIELAIGKNAWLGIDGRIGQRDLLDERMPRDLLILIYAPSLPEHHEYASARVTLSFGL
jgi:hypothetical protein